MKPSSPWALHARKLFSAKEQRSIFEHQYDQTTVKVYHEGSSLWALAYCAGKVIIAFRMAFSADDMMTVSDTTTEKDVVTFQLQAQIGKFTVRLYLPPAGSPILHYTSSFVPAEPLLMPFWPRDVVILHEDGIETPEGNVYMHQAGLRTGMLYCGITQPSAGALLYWQNLTALNSYCADTGTSLSDRVGGQWPELGLSLPPAKEEPLHGGKEYVLSDAYILLHPQPPADEFAMARQFLDMMADIYCYIPKPDTIYQHWPDILVRSLNDLQHNAGCWRQVQDHAYLNAYVSDYETPPEIMVQLAVLLPILDYSEWSKRELDVINEIKEGLDDFYSKELGTLHRWLPALESKLDDSEDHKKPRIMDSWYLHHPMLNLSRMALKGDKNAERLFFDSLEFMIKVAHHFNYEWPVFYDMYTLKITRAETEPGKGGEKDVAGIYALVMLQALELTGNKRYLEEAEKAARTLQGKGFHLFYQANNTAFAAGAMLRLWKITRDELYLNLSYLCLANVFKNIWLWDCNYGYGRHYPTFFALFPLDNAPYTAVYEEQEGFSAFHDYLLHADGEQIPASVSLLLSEFIRYLLHRAVYYYPPMLPEEMLEKKPTTGELINKLWIPLEDIQDGWKKSGTVGQEVYGAGLVFGMLPRHYMTAPDNAFMIFIDYPWSGLNQKDDSTITFHTKGDSRLTCRMLLMPAGEEPLPELNVEGIIGGKRQAYSGRRTSEGYMEYTLSGNQELTISRKNKEAGKPAHGHTQQHKSRSFNSLK